MDNHTAIGAKSKAKAHTITFKDKAHENFYKEYLPKCRYQDVYHKALVYCMGISEDTRRCVNQIYDFKMGYVNTECLHQGFITSGSAKIIRMAFNLYCNGTPSVDEDDSHEEQLKECRRYSVEDLFCCSYANYFMEAIKIRYPEYCYPVDWEEL